MAKTFTFKTDKPTGRYRAFGTTSHYIKLAGKECGSISDNDYRIRLKVIKDDINEDSRPNCKWKWIKLKYTPTSLEDAKRFLKEHSSNIQNRYNLHLAD